MPAYPVNFDGAPARRPLPAADPKRSTAWHERFATERHLPDRCRGILENCLLRRQAHAARTDQAGIGRLEAPERPARCTLEVNVLVVGAAEREISRR